MGIYRVRLDQRTKKFRINGPGLASGHGLGCRIGHPDALFESVETAGYVASLLEAAYVHSQERVAKTIAIYGNHPITPSTEPQPDPVVIKDDPVEDWERHPRPAPPT